MNLLPLHTPGFDSTLWTKSQATVTTGTQPLTAVPRSALLQMRSRSVQQRESSKGHLEGTTEDRMAGQQPLVKGTPAQHSGDSHSQDGQTKRSQDTTSRRRQKLGKIHDSALGGQTVRQQLG